MKEGEARRYEELEIEDANLKEAVADLMIDNQILKEANDYLRTLRARATKVRRDARAGEAEAI